MRSPYAQAIQCTSLSSAMPSLILGGNAMHKVIFHIFQEPLNSSVSVRGSRICSTCVLDRCSFPILSTPKTRVPTYTPGTLPCERIAQEVGFQLPAL